MSPELQRLWWTDQDAFHAAYAVFLQQQAISGGAACAAPAAAPVPPVPAAPVAASVAAPVAPVLAAKCKGACAPPFVFFLKRCSCTPSSSFPWQARWGMSLGFRGCSAHTPSSGAEKVWSPGMMRNGHKVCPHFRRFTMCADCGGGSICKHGRQRHWCKACGGLARCFHGKQKSRCGVCRGGKP